MNVWVEFESLRQTVKYILDGGRDASLPGVRRSHVRDSPFTIDKQSYVLLEQNVPFCVAKNQWSAERGKINTSFGTERYGWLRGCDGWLRERQIDKEGAMCARKFRR